MSSLPSYTNLAKDNSSPKKLAASRWAPGGAEDQMMAKNNMTGVEPSNNKAATATAKGLSNSRWSKDPVDKSSDNKATKGLSNSRWSACRGEYSQFGSKKKDMTANKNKNNEKASNAMLNQPRRFTNLETPPTPETKPAPRCIIGPLSEEEKTVKMENPFFDPTKHKGLSSSRWANE